MDEMQRQWASNIRFGRRGKGLTQAGLAEKCGVTQQTVAKWESGQLVPRDAHKRRIAAVCEWDGRAMFPLLREPEAV